MKPCYLTIGIGTPEIDVLEMFETSTITTKLLRYFESDSLALLSGVRYAQDCLPLHYLTCLLCCHGPLNHIMLYTPHNYFLTFFTKHILYSSDISYMPLHASSAWLKQRLVASPCDSVILSTLNALWPAESTAQPMHCLPLSQPLHRAEYFFARQGNKTRDLPRYDLKSQEHLQCLPSPAAFRRALYSGLPPSLARSCSSVGTPAPCCRCPCPFSFREHQR